MSVATRKPPHGTALMPVPPSTIGIRFGHRLRDLRNERGLTQMQMAVEFGIDRSFISDVERGAKSPSLAMIEVFAVGLRIKLCDMFQGVDE